MVKTTTLGGTAKDVVVGKVAHGLMTMTVSGNVPDEQAFEAIKAGVDTLPPGAKMILNSADFYGEGHSVGNLELLARFYDKYPDYASKTFLSIKAIPLFFAPPGKTVGECLKQSVERSIEALRGTKRIDLFQPSRLDGSLSVEDTVRLLSEMVKEGKFDHIGLSECSAASLRRGHAVHPISIAEIEISPMSYEEETKKVIATAAELDIAINAYSPLGRGLFTGSIKTVDDIPENSSLRRFDRFKEENLKYNVLLVEALTSIASKKGCTPGQLSIAWVGALGEKVIPLPGSSKKTRTLENLGGGDVELTQADLDEIASVLEKNPVHGHRYLGKEVDLKLWG